MLNDTERMEPEEGGGPYNQPPLFTAYYFFFAAFFFAVFFFAAFFFAAILSLL